MSSSLHIRRNDQVLVTRGKDRGKQGKVLRVIPSRNRAIVERINMIKRHTRPNPQRNIKGGIVEREASIHVSNLMIVSPEDNKPTRIGSKLLADGRRARVSRRSGAVLAMRQGGGRAYELAVGRALGVDVGGMVGEMLEG